MVIPDPKYLPQAKKKGKPAKKVKAAPAAAFPAAPRRPEAKLPKKTSPFGDKHVWAN